MFGRKHKFENFDEVMSKAVCSTVRDTLNNILNMNYKKVENGKEVTDYELTARMIKAQAKLAVDLIGKIEKEIKGED